MGSRLVDINCENIPSISRSKTVVNLDRLKSWFQLGCHRRLHCHCQRLMALDGVIY